MQLLDRPSAHSCMKALKTRVLKQVTRDNQVFYEQAELQLSFNYLLPVAIAAALNSWSASSKSCLAFSAWPFMSYRLSCCAVTI